MFGDRRMFLKLIPLVAILQAARCSIVVDSYSQKGIYIADYCPNMEFCPEGAHVMCMYYDPNHEMGPRCSNPQNLSITPVLANQLLEITNAIRSKIANGRETGMNGTRLPRGFGIFRLKWDNELATFAQVLANQCVLKHDLCRATKRFPDPGQAAGLVRFTHPDWIPVSKISGVPHPGLDDSKLSYSVTQTLKNWYMKKAYVTEDMILRYPPLNTKQNSDGRLYMEIIHGSATHMGCGISGYTEFTFYNTKRSMNYNSIQIICNFSSRPQPGEMSYSVAPAPGSSTCGCPEGSQEDSDCLCNEVRVQPRVYDNEVPADVETCANPDANCEPTVVLLPIFTVEDAPPNKLIEQPDNMKDPLSYITDRIDNGRNTVLRAKTLKLADFFDDAQASFQQPNALQQYPATSDTLSSMFQMKSAMRPPQTNLVSHLPAPTQNKTPRRAYANKRSESAQRRLSQSSRQTSGYGATNKKSSIFNRVAQFKLPTDAQNIDHYESIKPDVKPRKDFKKIQKAVDAYIKQRSSKFRKNEIIANKHHENLRKITFSTTPKIEENTETILNNVEEKLINFNNFYQRSNMSVDDNKHFDLNYEESDNKLMTLLDTLEREVKHIELDGNEKEIFDAKIRKIYDSVVGKPENLLSPKAKPKSNPSPKLKSNLHPPLDMLESDFGETKKYVKPEFNHITESHDDFQSRHESDHPLGKHRRGYNQEDDRIVNHARDYDYIDNKYNDKIDRNHIRKEDKEPDIYETKSYYENDMMPDTDHKVFSDIENKYNDHLPPTYSRNKLDQRYDDNGEKFGGKYDVAGGHRYTIVPTSRNRNNIGKYEDLKSRVTSEESRKFQSFDKYRDKDTMVNIPNDHERNHFRNGEDDRKRNVGNIKRAKEAISRNEFDQNDPLSTERKQYYQEKLESLHRSLRDRTVRRNKYDDRPKERTFRRMRPNLDHGDRQRSKTQGDSFYMPDRARFLHGF